MNHYEALNILESKLPKVQPLKLEEPPKKVAPFLGPVFPRTTTVVENVPIDGSNGYSLALLHTF